MSRASFSGKLRVVIGLCVAAVALSRTGQAAESGEGIIIKLGDKLEAANEKSEANPQPRTEATPPQVVRLQTAEAQSGAAQTKSPADWYIESLEKTVQLSAEQKEQIRALMRSRDAAMKRLQEEAAPKYKAAIEAIAEAQKSGDKDATAKAQKAYQDAAEPMGKMIQESQAKLDSVLTQEQRDKIRDAQAEATIRWTVNPAELSAEQREKLKAAFRDQSGPGEGRERNWSAIVEKVLTPEQKQKILRERSKNYAKTLTAAVKLSDQQQRKLDGLVEKIAEDATGLMDTKMYGSINKAVEDVLTEEQKEARKKQTYGAVWVPEGGQPGAWRKEETSKSGVSRSPTQSEKPAVVVAPEDGKPITIILREDGEERGLKVIKSDVDLRQGPAADNSAMEQRMKRQHELAERAWQCFRNLKAVGEDSPDGKKLHEELVRIEGELRQVLSDEPRVVKGPTGERIVLQSMSPQGGGLVYRIGDIQPPGAPADKLQPLRAEANKLAEIAKRLSYEIHELREAIDNASQPAVAIVPSTPATGSSDAEIRELRRAVESLRRQMEEIKPRDR